MTRSVLILPCAAIALACAGAGHADDQVPQEVKGWGRVADPDGDCVVSESKGKLTIKVPGTLHNLNPSLAANAPRVLRPVEGDFTATVKVTGDFQPGEKVTKPRGYPFNGAGLLVWKDDKNCLRLERNSWWIPEARRHACYTPLLEYYKGGIDQKTNPGSTRDEFFKGRSTHLRLERKGDKVTASYSHDGKQWTAVKAVTVDLPEKVQVGVAAVNSSDKEFVVEFEGFQVEERK